MAQALFDEHPLGDYLRDNGETPLLIPGTCPALEQELVDDFNTGFDDGSDEEWRPRLLLDLIEFLRTALSSAQADTPSPFVEKFKYNVISSSLLSSALPTAHSRHSSRSLSVTGNLHSRASSMDLDHSNTINLVPPSLPSYGMIPLSTASVVALFSRGYPLLAFIALIVTLLLLYTYFSMANSHQSDMTASFNSLDDLIQANQIWESTVQDAVSVLERDERMSFSHSPQNSPLTPSHVRVALHSCLQTTYTQCDNIRNIFSALTSPVELSQLSEMYAPHSPSNPESSKDPSTEEETIANSSLTHSESSHFGVAALELQRKRKNRASETFRTFPSASSSPRSARNSMFVSSTFSASKFTSLQPARHPLSLLSLKYAIQNTIAAKRYTCSHLLALRFSEEEDEGYWEDVRSVMGLLIGTLADASSRLLEVLDEAKQQSLQDQIPSPVLPTSDDESIFGHQQNPSNKPLKTDGRVSFAPMPNHISRFAAHVAAISSALDDARDHLEQCISALKEDSPSPSSFSGSSQRLQRSRNTHKVAEAAPEEAAVEAEVPVALQAYERLRRELGLALRECERGRDRLLEIVNPRIPSDEEEFDDLPSLGHDFSDDSDKADPISPDETDVVALINVEKVMVGGEGGDIGGTLIDDATSHLLLTATTKHLPMPGIEEVFEADMGTKAVFSRERSKLTREERIKAVKARRDSGLGLGIVLGGGGGDDHVVPPKMGGIEKWGPGGEVVQELKDVIWKVKEKRRKMADASQTAQAFENSS